MISVSAVTRLIYLLAVVASFSNFVTAQQQTPTRRTPRVSQTQSASMYPKSRLEVMAREWTRARDYTREYLNAMPEEGLAFKPVPEVRSFAEQMLHLANANFMFAANVSGQPNPYKDRDLEKLGEFKTKTALIRVVTESYDFAINSVKGMSDTRLDETMMIFGMARTRAAVLAAAFEHQTHHRGQTTIYLRLKAVTPPREKLF